MTQMPSGSVSHHQQADKLGSVPLAVVTVSDTRTPDTDVNGTYLRAQIEQSGNRLVDHAIIKDEPDQIVAILDQFCAGEARLILFNGGTGISTRDTTFDVISRKLEEDDGGLRRNLPHVKLPAGWRSRHAQ